MLARVRTLLKVAMVLTICLVLWHLASNHGRGGGRGRESGGQGEKLEMEEWVREKKRTENFKSSVEASGYEMSPSGGGVEIKSESDPDKGGVLETQIGEEKSNSPLILLWNNYQGDKSALYNKIFHRLTVFFYQIKYE